MSERNDTGLKTFTAGGAIAKHLRVVLSSGKLVAAGANAKGIGTILDEAFADLDERAVALFTKPGTQKMVAAGAISVEADVYGAAGGKISATVNGVYIGRAFDAASGNNSIIEVLPVHLENAAAFIADAVVAHDINSTFSDTEVEATLDALGVKINAALDVLETHGFMLSS